MKKIKKEVSFASVFLMLAVIFVHASSECVTGYDRTSLLFAIAQSAHRLSSFAVQGFIFLSGLKLFLRDEPFSPVRFYLKRVRRVVVPYVIVFSLFYVYFILTKRVSPSVSHFASELFSGGLVGHFYFVPVICQFYLLMPLWRLICKKADPAVTLTVSLILMLIFNSSMPELIRYISGADFEYNARLFTTYLFYFVAGSYAGKYYDSFRKMLTVRRRGIAVLFAVSGIIDCADIWLIMTKRAYPSWAETVHVLYCISAILFLLSVGLKLTEKENIITRILPVTERASYNVYLIHPLFIFVSESILDRLGIVSLSARFVSKAVLTYLFSVGGCVLLELITDKIKRKKRG